MDIRQARLGKASLKGQIGEGANHHLEDPMLKVSEQAAQAMKQILDNNQIEPGICFRLEPKENGKYGFSLVSKDSASQDERLIEWEGREVLLLPNDSSKALSGMTLHAKANPNGDMKLGLIQASTS